MPVKDEDLGRMVNDTWNGVEGFGTCVWEHMNNDDKRAYIAIGRALYDAGFQAGADSVSHE